MCSFNNKLINVYKHNTKIEYLNNIGEDEKNTPNGHNLNES